MQKLIPIYSKKNNIFFYISLTHFQPYRPFNLFPTVDIFDKYGFNFWSSMMQKSACRKFDSKNSTSIQAFVAYMCLCVPQWIGLKCYWNGLNEVRYECLIQSKEPNIQPITDSLLVIWSISTNILQYILRISVREPNLSKCCGGKTTPPILNVTLLTVYLHKIEIDSIHPYIRPSMQNIFKRSISQKSYLPKNCTEMSVERKTTLVYRFTQ